MTDKNKLELYYREEEVLRDLDDLEKELNEMSEANALFDSPTVLDKSYEDKYLDLYEEYHNLNSKFDTLLEDNDRLRKELLSTTKEYARETSRYKQELAIFRNNSKELQALTDRHEELLKTYTELNDSHIKLKAVLRKHVTVLKTVRSDLLRDGDLYAEDEDGHFGVTSSDYRI